MRLSIETSYKLPIIDIIDKLNQSITLNQP